MAIINPQPGDDIIASLYTRGFSLKQIADGLAIKEDSVAARIARMHRERILVMRNPPKMTMGQFLREQRLQAEETRRPKPVEDAPPVAP